MKKSILTIVFSAAASLATAASFTSTLIPEAGPNAVGLRVVQQYDYSRMMEVQVDVFGKAVNASPARPIQILIWYPAKASAGQRAQVVDYQQASLTDTDYGVSIADATEQRAGWLAGPQKIQFSASTLATRDAAPSAGTFPVVIYAPSFAASAHENLDLCEYLASHGYIVISSRSMGARSTMMTDDIEGVEAQAADIAFLANFAKTISQADMTKVAAMGYSWGGMANVFAAARSSRIKALVSLDGSIRYFPKIWSAAPYVRAANIPVPMLFLGAETSTAEMMETDDKLSPSFLNTMKYSDVYVTTMHPMKHPDFSSWNLRFANDGAFGDYQRADVLQAYRSGVLYVREFLNAYLKGDTNSLAFLRESPARHGIAPQVMSMEFHPAKFEPLTEADFINRFAKADYKDAQGIYSVVVNSSPDFKLSPLNLNNLGYQLFQKGNPHGAVELFKLATYIDPKYGNAFDSQGEAYEALGETALAIAAYEKAVAVDKDQANAVARINALRVGK